MRKSKTQARMSAREKISSVVEGWFLTEPLLFTAWTMHDVVQSASIATIRVAHGRIEFNPEFISSLSLGQLRSVLTFEAMRILLGHPYSRRQPNTELSYWASNLSVQECLRTDLPIERAREVFGDESFDDQYFEYYYRELSERADDPPDDDATDSNTDKPESSEGDDDSSTDQHRHEDDTAGDSGGPSESDFEDDSATSEGDTEPSATDGESADESPDQQQNARSELDAYADAEAVGRENASQWEPDDLRRDEINAALREAAQTSGWGSVAGSAKEQLLATLHPKLDYRSVLRGFRQSVLSVRRRLTRMKPNRRYGFAQMGSRYDFTTKLLFAVDVSGSMSKRDLRLGFSVIGQFFRYGIEAIDVVWFDDQVRCEPITLRRAQREVEVTGRGGTSFQPLMELIDRCTDYDGIIIFTDGYAPVPQRPTNLRTRILWLFKDEATYAQMSESLTHLGRAAFLHESPRES